MIEIPNVLYLKRPLAEGLSIPILGSIQLLGEAHEPAVFTLVRVVCTLVENLLTLIVGRRKPTFKDYES